MSVTNKTSRRSDRNEHSDRPTLSIVIPTYNEKETIGLLVDQLLLVLEPLPLEIIVVDDSSPDKTGDHIKSLYGRNPRVRLETRCGKQGLASAVFDGITKAHGSYICVMDADLSHDPRDVSFMLDKALNSCDLVIGSRYIAGGTIINWSLFRRGISWVTNEMARFLFRLQPRDVLSGFIVCRREIFRDFTARFSAGGFKFLLEVLTTQPHLTICEWPITFKDRVGGRSKANIREGVEFVSLCLRLLMWRLRKRTWGGVTPTD